MKVAARSGAVASRRFLAGVGVGALVLALASCGGGGGGNNDQGIAVRAAGIFAGQASINEDQITCQIPNVQNAIADTSFTIDLDRVLDFPNENDPFGNPCGGYIWLENNLLQEAVNITEIAIDYEVAGAAIQVPQHSVTTGFRVPSRSSTNIQPSGQPNVVLVQLLGQILPRPIVIFLQQNRNRLPARPFFMNVFLQGRGVSDSGTSYETNEVGYQLTIR